MSSNSTTTRAISVSINSDSTLSVKTATLEDALRTGQQAGYQYVHVPGANNCYIGDFLEELSHEEGEGFTDYVRVNNTVFRLADAWRDDAELYELN